ncbi:MAG: ATP-binding protein [Desulfobulbaceae bacterium]|nr:ATP-binding protein [Desulfobulbaceae bacterium]
MVFSASFENINLACSRIDDFLQSLRLEKYGFAVKLGAREILNNAVIHGSKNNQARKIRFKITLHGNRLFLKARDEGTGYVSSRAGRESGRVLQESGRGLAILHKYFDSVSFNESGNEIKLELNTTGSP